jgi:hypothetical protein
MKLILEHVLKYSRPAFCECENYRFGSLPFLEQLTGVSFDNLFQRGG